MLKTYVSFRFNRQKWSRQGISAGEPDDPVAASRQRRMGHVLHGFAYGVLLLLLILSTGVMAPPDRVSMHIARDQTWERNQQPERLDRWLSAALIDKSRPSVELPPGYFRLEGSLVESLQLNSVPSEKQIRGNRETTTLAISPALAERMQGPDGGPLQDAAECTVNAHCRLALDEHDLTLVNVRLRVEQTTQPDVAETQP